MQTVYMYLVNKLKRYPVIPDIAAPPAPFQTLGLWRSAVFLHVQHNYTQTEIFVVQKLLYLIKLGKSVPRLSFGGRLALSSLFACFRVDRNYPFLSRYRVNHSYSAYG